MCWQTGWMSKNVSPGGLTEPETHRHPQRLSPEKAIQRDLFLFFDEIIKYHILSGK